MTAVYSVKDLASGVCTVVANRRIRRSYSAKTGHGGGDVLHVRTHVQAGPYGEIRLSDLIADPRLNFASMASTVSTVSSNIFSGRNRCALKGM